jgi:methionyl aminopeptidase
VARAGAPLSHIGRAVEHEVRRRGFSVLPDLTGHGVGRGLHEPPSVPNCYDPAARETLREGLVITVEPLIAATPARVVTERDGWTARTHNRSLSAHHEHTIVITRGQPLILTAA